MSFIVDLKWKDCEVDYMKCVKSGCDGSAKLVGRQLFVE